MEPAEASDADLLQAIGRGNEPAFEELRHRRRQAVERACRSIVGTELEDCAQEVFVRIWRKAPLYDRSRGSAPAWLLTLARRTALNFRQARRAPLSTRSSSYCLDSRRQTAASSLQP